MTNREFLTAIAGMTETHPELAEFASAQIEKMDNALAARKEKNAQKPDENAELRANIAGVLTAEVQTTADIAGIVGVSVPKASAQLRKLVASGVAVVSDVKVPGKGTQKGYALAPADAE